MSDAMLRERVHNFWPACLGLSPYNTIIEHGISCSVTSRCCEFHEKLTAFSIALRDAARAEAHLCRQHKGEGAIAIYCASCRDAFIATARAEAYGDGYTTGFGVGHFEGLAEQREREAAIAEALAGTTGILKTVAALIRAQGFDPIADHKLSAWDEQGGEA